MSAIPPKQFRIRSFVRRDGRLTAAQERAKNALWPLYGLDVQAEPADFKTIFGRVANTYLEIGFGSGHSLLALAKSQPEHNFIGVETHKPGIGALFLGMQTDALTNLRVYYADVIDVLEKAIPDNSLSGIQIFFPDPWQKRRHHARRLIQPAFVSLLVRKLVQGGLLHLATDWEDYATHMLQVVSAEPVLFNLAGDKQFALRSSQRPVVTKFERRAEREGRQIRELQFKKR